ncbi:MAG: hypothetical protein A2W99_03460 [Bacteroidetes bacterium GWF2_33_16]|nr:MAG: hypothetical protein A2X00_11610 [Bacteroidetes bacterium GWE2_32_14]OFY08243.1 MAG: hypothetical protein A2W99_03460 [Bacteroidetes bacterium GWF2_33_16]
MKILAIEKELDSTNSMIQNEIFQEEAKHVYELYQKEIIREIYFTDTKNAILILECKDKYEAKSILNEFPLVKTGMIDFNMLELHSYTGYSRLFK